MEQASVEHHPAWQYGDKGMRKIPSEPLPDDDEIEVTDWEGSESSYDTDLGIYDGKSSTRSVESLRYRCYVENGRKHPEENPHNYWSPADEKQYDSMYAGHLFFIILDSQLSNKLFRSPIGPNPRNIIDLGSGSGDWAVECAEMYPDCNVVGVDLNPPPQPLWLPANCTLEVDDVSKPWTWMQRFDLVHIRQMAGAFPMPEWQRLYQQVYDSLEPGGWIEQVELDPELLCDDDSIPQDSVLRTVGRHVREAAAILGNTMDVERTMKETIESKGFVNVHERRFKCPIGSWPRHPIYKDAGRMCLTYLKNGMEGWTVPLFTKFGNPPWTTEEVMEWLARVQSDLDKGYHVYHHGRRVWAQKPFEEVRSDAASVADSQITMVEESMTDTETLYEFNSRRR